MKKLKPNVKAGGQAKPIGDNLYYMSGRKHSQGGIDIGDTLEVEGGEVIQTTPKEVKVFSAQPILNGNSPAKLVMGGANPNKVFNAQEQFKDKNKLNDDGTTKAQYGTKKDNTDGELKTREPGDSPYEDTRLDISRKRMDLRKGAGKATGLNIGAKSMKILSKVAKTNRVLGPILEIASSVFPSKEAEYIEQHRAYGRDIMKQKGTVKMKYGGSNKVVTVNGNVVNRTIADIDFPSSTGGRQKAALGSRGKFDDLLDWVSDKQYEERVKKVNKRNADKTKRANRTKVLREEGLQEVYSKGRVKNIPIDNPNESSLYRKAIQFNTTKRELPDVPKNNDKKVSSTKDYYFRIGNKNYKKGDTYVYKGQTYQVTGRNKSVPYNNTNTNNTNTNNTNTRTIDKDVQAAANRDAKGARTDYRSMLEVPTFDMDFKGNVPKSNNTNANFSAVPVNAFDVETPIESISSAKPNKTISSVPRRGSGNAKPTNKPAAKSNQQSTSTINTKPKFADLTSMIQGLPTTNSNLPTKLDQKPNANVPDIVSSSNKRLALFDKLDTNDIIGLGSNLVGTIASGISTRKQLNKMEAPKRPNPIMAQRMKTNFNINPQLGEIEENTNRMINDIGANTSSSRTRLQRVQRARNAAQYSKNNLRGQKENIETQLINQDKMNRQQVSAANTAQFNAWQDKTSQFNNSIREQRASSLNNMFSGINAGIQDMVGRIENRRNYKNTLAMYDATHPNVDKRLFTSKGLTF